jgi:RNA polymerase sigma-70 factor, ECF subfamily
LPSGRRAPRSGPCSPYSGHWDRIPLIPHNDGDVTGLLIAWSNGDQASLDRLVPLVYDELRRIAGRYMKGERQGHTIQATALVNEAYLRLVEIKRVRWQNRAQFFGVAARSMRRILVDAARARRSQKRGAGAEMVPFDEALVVSHEPDQSVIDVDEALQALTAMDERKGRVVELRYFGGLTVSETAEVLKVSPETVMRDWDFAKAWMSRELRRNAS